MGNLECQGSLEQVSFPTLSSGCRGQDFISIFVMLIEGKRRAHDSTTYVVSPAYSALAHR